MLIRQVFRCALIMSCTAAVVVLGSFLQSGPAAAQEITACVSKRLGLVRFVDAPSNCRSWGSVRFLGGGGGAGIKYVFATSGSYTGDLVDEANTLLSAAFDDTQGLAAGDAICNHHAGLAFLPGTYVAWLSTDLVDAASRLPETGPWFNVKGELVAATLAGLLNTANVPLYNAIAYTELGEAAANPFNTWTGTNPDGTGFAGQTCAGWTDPLAEGIAGAPNNASTPWTFGDPALCTDTFRLYCFQDGAVGPE